MIRRGSNLRKYVQLVSQSCVRNNQHLASVADNSDDAHYPKIKPKYPPGKWGNMDPRHAWMWGREWEQIAKCRTYQEKINFLTEHIHKVWVYNSIETTPNLLPYKGGVTKTTVKEVRSLEADDGNLSAWPSVYNSVNVEQEFERMKQLTIEVLEQVENMNHDYLKRRELKQMHNIPGNCVIYLDYKMSRVLISSLLTNILGNLGGRHEHILNSHYDENSTVAAFWNKDGVENFKMFKKVSPAYLRKQSATFFGEQAVDFHIRKDKPLPEFASLTDDVCCKLTYDKSMLDYYPGVLGQFYDHKQKKISQGYTIGDPCKFTHLNVIFPNNKAMNLVSRYGEDCRLDAETGYLLSTGFLTTLSQAHALGFNQYEEITYPFTTQTILTDGQNFTLSAYQLNTTQMWKDDEANELQNVLWKTKSMKLFEKYENGKVVGFNDELFTMLLKFLLIEPSDRNGIDLSPNIDSYPEKQEIDDVKFDVFVEKPIIYESV
ncbi:Mitochondrial 28S ribosomal protein S30 (PDCD9) [Mactra antiquata]